jgi:hypothetical protein
VTLRDADGFVATGGVSTFPSFRDGWRTAIAVVVLVCSGITAWWLILSGRPENLLHQSALSWSFTLIAVILAAFVLGSVMQYVPHLIWRK